MPYFTEEEFKQVVDVNGTKIQVGDLLERVNMPYEDYPWRWYICFENGDTIDIRDLNANNVHICTVGEDGKPGGNVVTRGHYSNIPGILSEDDLEYYFDIKREDDNNLEY